MASKVGIMRKQEVATKLRRLVVSAVLAVIGVGVGPAAGRAQTGRVVGSVYDSIAGGPLEDAAVFLWQTPYRAVSDADGRFRITTDMGVEITAPVLVIAAGGGSFVPR